MIALVTGCAGFIGSHLTDTLLTDGEEVIGIDSLRRTYSVDRKVQNLSRARDFATFEFVEADLVSAELVPLVERCDVIFHLAGEPGVRDSWGPRFADYVRNNIIATQRLLEAVAPLSGRRLVLASSSSVYGMASTLPITEDAVPAPISPYGVSKLGSERLCVAYALAMGVDAVALRYFSVFGPRQRPDMAFSRFIDAALRSAAIEILGSGQQMRDFTFVDDVVRATRAAALAPVPAGSAYNIGRGSTASVASVLEILEAIVGRRLQVEYRGAAPGDVAATHASIDRAATDLRYSPAVSLSEGLQAQHDWAVGREGIRSPACAEGHARSTDRVRHRELPRYRGTVNKREP